MNPISQELKIRLEQKLREGVVEIPPPIGRPVYGPCKIPKTCLLPTGDIDNRYTTIRDPELGTIGRHVAACIIGSQQLPPPGMQVLHGCDRKCCFSDAHLRFGTRAEDRDEAKHRERFLSWDRGERLMPQGEHNPIAKMSDAEAAGIKWLVKNKTAWFTPDIQQHHTFDEAIAIFYNKSVPSVKCIRRLESWRYVEPIRPASLPSATQIPPAATPPAPEKTGPIGAKGAEELLRGYAASDAKSEFVSDAARRLGVSQKSIYNVLTGVTWKEVAPEIARVKFETHGMQIYSDRTVQEIRATWDLHKSVKGLRKGLARKFGMTITYVTWIVERILRKDVPDDPSAALRLEELEIRSAPSGGKHKKCKLPDEKIIEVYEAHKAGVSKIDIAKSQGVSWNTIEKILKGETRSDLFKKFHDEQ